MRWLWFLTTLAILIAIGLIQTRLFDPLHLDDPQWTHVVGEVRATDPQIIWLDPTLPTRYALEVVANRVVGPVQYGVVVGSPAHYWAVAVSAGMVRVWEMDTVEVSLVAWTTWPLASLTGYVETEQTFWIRQHQDEIEVWINRQHLWTGAAQIVCDPCQIGLWRAGIDYEGIVNFEKVLLFYD